MQLITLQAEVDPNLQKQAGFSLVTTLALNFSQSPEQSKYKKPALEG